ncbi:pyruvate kinase alpha/beta domain-containing protein [Chloroflexota bacterium]
MSQEVSMEGKIVYFDKPGRDNTEEVLRIAKSRADELGIQTIVVATTMGDTAARAVEVFPGRKVVVVTHFTGMKGPDVQELTDENRREIESKGGIILTTMHAFAGVSRALRQQFETMALGEIIANTLRILGQGIKVVCEVAVMATDAGLVRTDEDVVIIAGTGRGADTAVVLTPVNSTKIFDLKVKEILCKPYF